MSREAMKALIRAEVECTDESVGGWLDGYAEGRLDEKRSAAFRAHLCECLQCMALYNVETKHKHGYIDPERTRTRRVKVLLLDLLPSPAQLLAALSLLVVVGSFAATHTPHFIQQETAQKEPDRRPDEQDAQPSPSPMPRETAGAFKPAGSPESKRECAGRGNDTRPAPTPEGALDARPSDGVDAAAVSTPPPPPTRTPEPGGGDKVATREEPQEIPTEFDEINPPEPAYKSSYNIGAFTGVSLTEEGSTQGTEPPRKEKPPPEPQPGGGDEDYDRNTIKGYFGKCGSDDSY